MNYNKYIFMRAENNGEGSSSSYLNYRKISVFTAVFMVFTGFAAAQTAPDVSIGQNGVQINSGGLGLGGGDITDGGTTVWDSSNGYIPAAQINDGPGSGLDADTLDGSTIANIRSGTTATDVGLGNVQNEAQVAESGDTMTGNLNMGANALTTDLGKVYDISSETALSSTQRTTLEADSDGSSGGPYYWFVDETDGSLNGNSQDMIDVGGDLSELRGASRSIGASDASGNDLLIEANDDMILQVGQVSGATSECTINSDTGDFSCDGTKSWVHDLDNGKEAYYTSQESPEVRAVYEGKVTSSELEDGYEKVELPEHFSITVSDTEPMLRAQATPDKLVNVAVTEKTDDYIVIKSSEAANVDYRITGIRDGYEDKQVVRPKEK